MKLLKAIIRPNKLEEVKDALTALNVTGMTVTEVRGHGRQKGHKAVYRGAEYSVTLLPKIMIELVLQDERVEEVLKSIINTARTGEIGDGRVLEHVGLVEFAHLVQTLKQEEQLRGQRVARGVLVEARQKRVCIGVLEQRGAAAFVGEQARQAGLARAYGTLDYDVTVFSGSSVMNRL